MPQGSELQAAMAALYHRRLRPGEASLVSGELQRLQAQVERLSALAEPALAAEARREPTISLSPAGSLLVHLPGGTKGHTLTFAPGATQESQALAFAALLRMLAARNDGSAPDRRLATPAAPTNAQLSAMIKAAAAEGKVQKCPTKGGPKRAASPTPKRKLSLADLKINLADLKL